MAGMQNAGEAHDNPVAVNITAMVDVIFCLCLFFMCSFHFKQFEGKIDTNLPKDKGDKTDTRRKIIDDELRVILRMDETTHEMRRKVQPFNWAASDEELVSCMVQIRDGYKSAGNNRWPLVIEAKPNVPWQEVIHVMDLCKSNQIDRIEFAAPEIEIIPDEKP